MMFLMILLEKVGNSICRGGADGVKMEKPGSSRGDEDFGCRSHRADCDCRRIPV